MYWYQLYYISMIDEKDVSPTNMPKQTLPKDSKEDEENIIQWVNEIKDESKREVALGELSRKREMPLQN